MFLAPQAPKMEFDQIGPDAMNISYKAPTKGAAADYIAVKYYKKGKCFKVVIQVAVCQGNLKMESAMAAILASCMKAS